MSRTTVLVAAAAGLIAATAVDALLALTGAAQFEGLPLGVLAAALLLLVASGQVRRGLATDPAATLLVVGVAWSLAPFIDQHLTGAVVIDSAAADLVHHLAGVLPLVVAVRRRPQPISV